MSIKKKSTLSAAVLALIAVGASAPKISEQFLKEKEGYSTSAYRDGVGIPTICDGLTTYRGERVRMGMRLTDSQCSEESERQKQAGYKWIDNNIRVELSEPQKAAVFSFCYWNLGPTKCMGSTFYQRINKGDFIGACEAIKWWIKDQGKDCKVRSNNCYGQVIRRDQESELACWGLTK